MVDVIADGLNSADNALADEAARGEEVEPVSGLGAVFGPCDASPIAEGALGGDRRLRRANTTHEKACTGIFENSQQPQTRPRSTATGTGPEGLTARGDG